MDYFCDNVINHIKATVNTHLQSPTHNEKLKSKISLGFHLTYQYTMEAYDQLNLQLVFLIHWDFVQILSFG